MEPPENCMFCGHALAEGPENLAFLDHVHDNAPCDDQFESWKAYMHQDFLGG